MDIIRKSIDLDFTKSSVREDGTFEVYVAVFHNIDSYGDVIVPGAFKNLPAFIADGYGIVNHKNGDDLGIATIDSAEEDFYGLKVKGRFHSTPDAQAVRVKLKERLERGKTCKCSFGYAVLDAVRELRDGKEVLVLKALNIYEFSFVNLPANTRADVVGVKGATIEIPKLSDIKSDIARARIEVKAGRTLSAATLAKLKAVHDAMCPACDDLKALLEEHGPEKTAGDAAPTTTPDDEKSKSQAKAWDDIQAQAMLLATDPCFIGI
jgi:HK97 family phage prohead protease